MPFITLSNLRQFFKNLLSKNLVFTKALTIAPDLTKEKGVTKIGSYWASDGQIQQPLLAINNDETSGGVFYRGKEVATKDDITAGGGNITVDDTLSDTSTNPVQNKVIKGALDNMLSTSSPNDGTHITWNNDKGIIVRSTKDNLNTLISPGSVSCSNSSNRAAIGVSVNNSSAIIQAVVTGDNGLSELRVLRFNEKLQYGNPSSDTLDNIATEAYVKANYVQLSNGHISINGSELWIE